MILSKIKGHKHCIWDWNGTLVDDVSLAVEALGLLMSQNNLNPLSIEEYRERFCFPLERFYTEVGLVSKSNPFEKVAQEFITYYDNNYKRLSLFPNILEILKTSNFTHSILSAAPEVHLLEITKNFGIDSYFENIYGLGHVFGDSKIKRGQELLEKLDYGKEEIVLIGDTDHDLEVGKALGVSVLLVADGHQSFQKLSKVHKNVLKTRFP